MTDPILKDRAASYAKLCRIGLDLETPLGFGNDGTVWKSDRKTAVKALYREINYRNELECYQRFSTAGITDIYGFSVPQLIGSNELLQIIEITIVTPPFILDFGKVWFDKRPDYPAETWQEYHAGIRERFDDRTPTVEKILSALVFHHGIWYMDPKPGNIAFENEPSE
jgi:hypothetical protein